MSDPRVLSFPLGWARPGFHDAGSVERYRQAHALAVAAYLDGWGWDEIADRAGWNRFGSIDCGRGAWLNWCWSRRYDQLSLNVRGSNELWRDWIRTDAASALHIRWERLYDLPMPYGFAKHNAAVLDQLDPTTASSATRAAFDHGLLNADNVQADGHSLGGMASVALHAVLRDKIRRSTSIDGARAFGKEAAQMFFSWRLDSEVVIHAVAGWESGIAGMWPRDDQGASVVVLERSDDPELSFLYRGDLGYKRWKAKQRETRKPLAKWYRPVTWLVRRLWHKYSIHPTARITETLSRRVEIVE